MKRFVEVPAERIRETLAKAGFVLAQARGREEVYERAHHADARYTIKVYSSIARASSTARGCGEDAIRVVATFRAQSTDTIARGVFKAKRIYRTGSVEAVLERMLERMRDAYGFCGKRIVESKKRGAA